MMLTSYRLEIKVGLLWGLLQGRMTVPEKGSGLAMSKGGQILIWCQMTTGVLSALDFNKDRHTGV